MKKTYIHTFIKRCLVDILWTYILSIACLMVNSRVSQPWSEAYSEILQRDANFWLTCENSPHTNFFQKKMSTILKP